jgi:hypothetical protein
LQEVRREKEDYFNIRRGTGRFQEEVSLLEIYCKIVQVRKAESSWRNG